MSISAGAVAETSLGGDRVATTSTSSTPPSRRMAAKADVVQPPEPR